MSRQTTICFHMIQFLPFEISEGVPKWIISECIAKKLQYDIFFTILNFGRCPKMDYIGMNRKENSSFIVYMLQKGHIHNTLLM